MRNISLVFVIVALSSNVIWHQNLAGSWIQIQGESYKIRYKIGESVIK